MAAMTVRGPLNSGNLGTTLLHEHLFIDLRFYVEGPTTMLPQGPNFPVSGDPVQLSNLGGIQRNMFTTRDNLVLDDLKLATQEVGYFKDAGGSTLVDVTPWGIGKNPVGLRTVSEQTGVNIIASCGYYQRETYPPYVETESLTSLVERMIGEIDLGIEDTGVRAGIIGEIGANLEPDAVERKVHEAVAVAHCETGAAIIVHPCNQCPTVLKLSDFLERRGVDLTKVIISHLDSYPFDWKYLRAILQRGANVEFDNFGHEQPRDWELLYPPTDWQRVEAVAALVAEGYVRQIFVSTDICFKAKLRAYGGWGYAHLLVNIQPYLRAAGLSESDLSQILGRNPARVLDLTRG